MIVQLYTIAFLHDGTIDSALYKFDSEDEDDLFALSEIIVDEGLENSDMTQAEFETVCRKYLYEGEVAEWGQRFVNCIVVNIEQLNKIKNIS
jgi:hypothetical protein